MLFINHVQLFEIQHEFLDELAFILKIKDLEA